jgi:protein SCO1/2
MLTIIRISYTPPSLQTAAKVFRVYYSKPIEDDSLDYLVDHTIIMYLMDPEFEFAQYFGQFMQAEEMAEGMAKTIAAYKK